tara:strand:+ start:70 stop:1347 length:1278 start_codon:yes stop_codon:yes gene_type:complete
MESITVIGAGLTGCLTAYKIAKKYPKKKVYLIDASKKILGGFNSVNISSHRINNGYHGIDVNRNLDLFNFLNKKIKISFKLFKDNRKIIFNNLFLKDGASLAEYPLKIKKLFKTTKIKNKDPLKILSKLPNLYKNTLSLVSKRYSGDLKNDIKFFVPWFLPKEFELISKDEGDIFRKKVRNKKIKSYIAYPQKDLFETFAKYFQKRFNKIANLDVILNTKISITNNEIFFIKKNKKITLESRNVIFCTNIPFFLKNVMSMLNDKKMNKKFFILSLIKTKKFKHDFTETIIADKSNINFMRISKKKQELNNYFVMESIVKNPKDINRLINEKKIRSLFKTINSQDNLNPKVIGTKITRSVFFPNKLFLKKLSQKAKKEFKKFQYKNKNINFFTSFTFSPINMSKSWNESEKFTNKITESFKNESSR